LREAERRRKRRWGVEWKEAIGDVTPGDDGDDEDECDDSVYGWKPYLRTLVIMPPFGWGTADASSCSDGGSSHRGETERGPLEQGWLVDACESIRILRDFGLTNWAVLSPWGQSSSGRTERAVLNRCKAERFTV
jgi:hypothetical protein